MTQRPPAACSLAPTDAAERRQRFDALCRRALIDHTLTDTGLRLRFGRRPGVEDELRELARLEATCCGFARFEVTEVSDELHLEVIAPPEAVATTRRLFAPVAGPNANV